MLVKEKTRKDFKALMGPGVLFSEGGSKKRNEKN